MPTATPPPLLAADAPGWVRYTNRGAGFSFAYPVSWSLVEVPATGSKPAAVWLRWELYRLVFEYAPAARAGSLTPLGSARNWREEGRVTAFGHDAAREVMYVEDRAKRVTYRVDGQPLEVGDLAMAVLLRSVAADECLAVFDLECDYASVDLPEQIQDQATQIVETLELAPVRLQAESADVRWSRFVRADFGFELRYPPEWVLSEGRNFAALTRDTAQLVIGYAREAEEINVCCTLGQESGSTRDAGEVQFVDRAVPRSLVGEGNTTHAVVYNGAGPMESAGRVFVAYLQDRAAESSGAGIPADLQSEADQIVSSLVILESVVPLPEPAPMPTVEPATPTPTVAPPPDALVRGRESGGNVRAGPGTLYDVLGFLGPDESAPVVGRYRDWWQIDYGGERAWVANGVVLAENVESVAEVDGSSLAGPVPREAGPVLVVGASRLNVRGGPGSDYVRLGSLEPGSQASIVGKHGNWWQIGFGGGEAWVSGDYVTPFHVETVPDVDPPRVATSPSPAVIPPPARPGEITEERWIDLDLGEQRLTAYQDSVPIYQTLVSTGLPATPTPTGQFRIWIKLRYDDMSGPGYYLEDVPYVMYFYQGYGFHGVWWHGNFGHPMSHGCVNLPNGADEWLFNWADVGTLVNVHD